MGMTKAASCTLESIISKFTLYYPNSKSELIRKAFAFAEVAHQGQLRSSGDPYMVHPASVAQTLADLRLDMSSIIAGLLHDTVEDTHATLPEIESKFGKEIAELVDGVTKLSKITFKTSEEKQAENFRKMILAMSKDIRVILVKLADRLNNMQTLEYKPPHKQKLIAQETLDIYAPIANRLGISWIKCDLEDLALRYLHPEPYYKLARKIAKTKKEREKYIEEVSAIFEERLEEYDVKAQVSGRAKHFYSIYKKMERRKVEFEQVFDLIAFRIVVDNITECYKALGVIHAAYKPVPGRFKDYIAMPKANAYQSLHTTVIGPYGERVEIQLRTQDMNQVAEGGIAAHWKYKEGKFDTRSRENIEWVNRLLEWQKDLTDPNEFLETVKIDLFAEDVFIFTPKGEVKKLVHGASPIDFAYAVHSDVGHHCVGAKVNGKIVPLKHRLKSGDTVEIITSVSQAPSKDWLKIVKSSRAKAKIRSYIKSQEQDRALKLGKEMLDKALRAFNHSLTKLERSKDLDNLISHFGAHSKEELYISVGYGLITTDSLIKELVPKNVLDKDCPLPQREPKGFLERIFKSAKKKPDSQTPIRVENLDDVLIRFGRCCNPLPGDAITGFITRGRGVTIHIAHCTKAEQFDQIRTVRVEWSSLSNAQMKRRVRIRVVCGDEPGMLALISQTIHGFGINIASAQLQTSKDKISTSEFEVEVGNLVQLERLMSTLSGKKGITSVDRLKS